MFGKVKWNADMTICKSHVKMGKIDFIKLAKQSHFDNTGEFLSDYHLESNDEYWTLFVQL